YMDGSVWNWRHHIHRYIWRAGKKTGFFSGKLQLVLFYYYRNCFGITTLRASNRHKGIVPHYGCPRRHNRNNYFRAGLRGNYINYNNPYRPTEKYPGIHNVRTYARLLWNFYYCANGNENICAH